MKNATIKTSDYLFMQFRTATPTLDQVCDIYYPHLSKAKRLEKARNGEFPFSASNLIQVRKHPTLLILLTWLLCLKKDIKLNLRNLKILCNQF